MEPLFIKYSTSNKVKYFSFTAGGYLLLLSLALFIQQTINKDFGFLFYIGIAGIVVAVLLFLILTVWQSGLYIEINSDEFIISIPKQDIKGAISWNTISQVGIGLSYITLKSEDDNYKLDFGNLKFNDIRKIKTKLIEVCEEKEIPFSNI